MGGGNWLRALKMRVRRHQRILERLRVLQHHLLQRPGGGVQFDTCIHRPEPCCGRNLIVSASACVQLRRDVPHLFMEHPVDHRVHVFIGWDGCRSCSELICDRREPLLDLLAFVEGDDARLPKSDSPRTR